MSETRTTATTIVATKPAKCSTRWFQIPGENRVVNYNYPSSPFTGKMQKNYFEDCYTSFRLGMCPNGIPVNAIAMTSSEDSAPMWTGKCCVLGTWERSFCQTTFSTPFTAIVGYTTSGTTFWDYTGPASDAASGVATPTPTKGGSSSPGSSIVTFKNTTVIPFGTLFDTPFTVAWKSTDLYSFPSAYAVSVASQMGVSFTVTPSPGATTIINALNTSGIGGNGGREREGGADEVASGPRVSAAGIAGIAVGCALGAIALFAAVLLTLRWRRRKRRQGLEVEGENQGDGLDGRIVTAYEADAYQPTPELFDAHVKVAEIDSQRAPAELG
ncbi:hypothetical protein DM02DRAFT_635819 [Periconia macrospinosa]|uniref:Uncharacterized protein n=1 Tax=Periconia macrospinosa TaxID=97972 RepID=A0A2V1D3R8_9PLEO|nr:hypothetical protein DM02DRAFT_635819 [Periconia macrospinosa]